MSNKVLTKVHLSTQLPHSGCVTAAYRLLRSQSGALENLVPVDLGLGLTHPGGRNSLVVVA
ncbi:hypothetical protein [Rhodococcoides yunnanense]|uniref:Uncharacterized protein n=1 Tax=Rhodococcoides yunnanense TaxID=278209 RepID=A0ABU4B9T9_9NOCA|nr:hypothetical protein [Rhodococcus yunnanensis]MDV6260968.1 hypothetical protein [Rhodococcus yunnanensis]